MTGKVSKLLAAAALVMAGTFGAGNAAGAAPAGLDGCKLRIEGVSYNWIIEGFDPFDTDQPQATYDVSFVNDGNAPCRFVPRFATDGAALGLQAGGATRLVYSLYDVTSGQDVTPRAGRTLRDAGQRMFDVAPGGQQLVRYQLNVGVGALPNDGRFTQRLFLVADGDRGVDFASRSINVGINIRPSAVIGLAGAFRRSNGQADVDLGELRTGVAQVPLQLNILSTRAYTLGFRSLNGGKLRLSGTEWSIPYRVVVGEQTLDVSSGAVISPRSTGTVRRDSLPLGIDVGPVDNKRAGTYMDLLTISVAVE